MPTVYNRIYAYSVNKKVPMLTIDQRNEIGKEIVEQFRKSGIKKRFHKTTANPNDCEGTVNYYPRPFRDTMDRIISIYYELLKTAD